MNQNQQRTAFVILFVVSLVVGLGGLISVLPVALVGLALIGVAGAFFGLSLQNTSHNTSAYNGDSMEEREAKAKSLRSSRERERAFYEMTSTLSSTLDYQKVLDEVQNVGGLITRRQGLNTSLTSAAFLFQGEDSSELSIASERGLTRKDVEMTVPGKQGVLGMALKQSEPVFASLPSRDPELQYFVGFQDCQSILAVALQARFEYYGVLVFGSPEPNAFSEDYGDFLKAIGTQATIALQNAVLYQDVLDEKERIVEVDEDARKKLARDLHDGPTQSIAAIAMRINYVRRMVEGSTPEAHQELGKIEDLARRTTKEIRHMLFTLRPLVLETQGLVAALQQFSEKMRDTHDLNVLIEAQPGIERWLDNHAQGVLFYLIEEAVNNARKHAQSQHIWVRLSQHEALFMVEVEDDGVGFDQSALEAGLKRNSLGMVNMRERAELVEGTLNVTSKEGEGTKISVLVPIHEGHVPASQTPQAKTPARKPQPDTRNATQPFIENKPNIPHATKRSPST